MIIVTKYLVPKGYAGMTVFPFILVRDKRLRNNSHFINHEKIHLRQQAELLVLPFFFWYVLEYLVRLFVHRNHHMAYRNICFEREAYANEQDNSYITKRPFYSFVKYLRSRS